MNIHDSKSYVTPLAMLYKSSQIICGDKSENAFRLIANEILLQMI